MLARVFPILTRLPAFANPLQKRNERLASVMGRIGDDLLEQGRNGRDGNGKDRSLIGTLS